MPIKPFGKGTREFRSWDHFIVVAMRFRYIKGEKWVKEFAKYCRSTQRQTIAMLDFAMYQFATRVQRAQLEQEMKGRGPTRKKPHAEKSKPLWVRGISSQPHHPQKPPTPPRGYAGKEKGRMNRRHPHPYR